MASGHVNRTNRPNTWLHRPATRREDFSLPTRSRPHMALFCRANRAWRCPISGLNPPTYAQCEFFSVLPKADMTALVVAVRTSANMRLARCALVSNLLPVDDVVIPVRHGPRLQGCEVGARAGFGIALRPIVLARTDVREIPVLLRRRPVVDDDGPDEMRAGRIVGGHAGAAAFEIEDIALHRRPAGAAMLDRPVRHRPALAVERR